MNSLGVQQIHVTRVTRIHNRFLRNLFEDKLESSNDSGQEAGNSIKWSLEYLFYGIDPV